MSDETTTMVELRGQLRWAADAAVDNPKAKLADFQAAATPAAVLAMIEYVDAREEALFATIRGLQATIKAQHEAVEKLRGETMRNVEASIDATREKLGALDAAPYLAPAVSEVAAPVQEDETPAPGM